MVKFCSITGIICVVYYFVIGIYTGGFGESKPFWLIIGVLCLIGAFLWNRGILPGWIRDRLWLRRGLLFLVIAGGIVFTMLEGMVVSGMMDKGKDGADYLLVLGAQIRGTKVTRSLAYRLQSALEYGKRNPDAILVVSGGKGSGEDITEAEAMKKYLIDHGLNPSSILMEDASVNTAQNVRFCREIIQRREGNTDAMRIMVVSNGFHIYRAKKIAMKQGFHEVEGLAAPTDPLMLPHYMVREAFAILKNWLVGNI